MDRMLHGPEEENGAAAHLARSCLVDPSRSVTIGG